MVMLPLLALALLMQASMCDGVPVAATTAAPASSSTQQHGEHDVVCEPTSTAVAVTPTRPIGAENHERAVCDISALAVTGWAPSPALSEAGTPPSAARTLLSGRERLTAIAIIRV